MYFLSQVQECCDSKEIHMSREDPQVIALIMEISGKPENGFWPDPASQVPDKNYFTTPGSHLTSWSVCSKF